MKKMPLLLLPLFVLFVTLSFADNQLVPTPTGFLTDYRRLVPDKRDSDNYFHYTAPLDLTRKLGKIYFMPITTYPVDTDFKLVDKPVMAKSMDALDQILRKKLGEKATLVASKEDADTVVQMVVTAVATVDAGRKPIDFIPLRLITKPLKDATMGKEQQLVVTLEVSIRDAKTNHVLFEAVHRSEGKNIGRSDDPNLKATQKDLEPVIDVWTNKIVNEIITPKL